jgi:hypothetical protein
MDFLTKSLIRDLLPESIDGKEVTAVFGGGFKPPTVGHLSVIQKALQDYPEIDNVIICVGSKVRDGITQDQSFRIWDEHYKQLIDKPVRIQKSVSPIGDIYRYAKDNPEDSIYWVIGAREGKEDDIQDITSRSVSINKYPNLNLKIINTPDGGMSGTNARQALIDNDKDSFLFFIPSNSNQDEIWNILTSTPLNESIKIDMSKVNKALLKGMGKEDETDENILALVDSHPQGKVSHKIFLNFYAKFDKYFGEKDDNRILDEIGLEYLLTRVLNLTPEEIRIVMNDYQKGNRDLEDIKWFEKYDTVHQKDEEWNPAGGEKFNDAQDNIATVNQYLSKNKRLHEADPKKGTGKKPKGSKRRLYTDENPKDTVKVKFSTRQDIIDTLSKTSFKSKPHARQSQIINLIHQRVRAALGRTKDPQKKAKLRSAFEYIKKRKEASKKKTQSLKKQKTNEAIDNSFDKVKFYHDYYTNLSPSTFEITLEENDIRISNITDPDPSLPTPENIRQIPVNQNLEENDPEDGSATPYGSGYNKLDEAIVGNSIVCDNCGWSWKIADGGDDLFICHKCGHDNTPLNEAKPYKHKHGFDKNLGKDPFGLNQFAREIMQEEKSFDTFDYPKHIKSLIKFMLDKGMKLRPLPTVKFINDDRENAKDFFGKTAYYDPNNHKVVLYTLNRHPKDVMRSFAHEMIHHMQNYEGKLQSIHTQNTNEEGDLPEIEREAYEKGNMAFRSWTDTLTEGMLKEGRYDTLSNQISRDIFNFWKKNIDQGLVTFENSYEHEGEDIDIEATIKLSPEIEYLNVDGGADDETDFIVVDFKVNPDKLPGAWEEISFNLKDVIRHEIEHLTHGEGFMLKPGKYIENDQLIRQMIDMELLPKSSYFKLEKEIDANLQGMYFRAKKERRPFIDVINTYLDAQDITPKEKQIVLNLWRSRRKALSLPKF